MTSQASRLGVYSPQDIVREGIVPVVQASRQGDCRAHPSGDRRPDPEVVLYDDERSRPG